MLLLLVVRVRVLLVLLLLVLVLGAFPAPPGVGGGGLPRALTLVRRALVRVHQHVPGLRVLRLLRAKGHCVLGKQGTSVHILQQSLGL